MTSRLEQVSLLREVATQAERVLERWQQLKATDGSQPEDRFKLNDFEESVAQLERALRARYEVR